MSVYMIHVKTAVRFFKFKPIQFIQLKFKYSAVDMSEAHLSTGSQQPAKVEGKLRLYSMKYCPFAHRVRLVLRAKNIPHDIVNVNLINKPEWISNVHPEGKVPALDTGSKVIVESLDIANFLDQEYPDPPLYPAEPEAVVQDKELIQKIGPLCAVFTDLIFQKQNKTPTEWLKEFEPHLNIFEEELSKRGTTYFGGDKPGMVDYMLWPWAERARSIDIVLKDHLPLQSDQYTKMRAWKNAMREQPAVAGICNPPEKFYKTVLFKTEGATPDYDNL